MVIIIHMGQHRFTGDLNSSIHIVICTKHNNCLPGNNLEVNHSLSKIKKRLLNTNVSIVTCIHFNTAEFVYCNNILQVEFSWNTVGEGRVLSVWCTGNEMNPQ